jgi:hypothetical protein
MAKHLKVTITQTSLSCRWIAAAIEAEAALDDVYMLRTNLSATRCGVASPGDNYSGPACGDLCASMSVKQKLLAARPEAPPLAG